MPDSEQTYPDSAEFLQDWFTQIGIGIQTPQTFDSGTLTDLMLPPEAGGEANKADYDLFIWGWGGDVDPNSLLEIFTCDQIGSSSDSIYCNEEYDALFAQQNAATSESERKALIDQMQEIFYRDAPYHILFYDAQLDAYRTDRFGGWQNQPTANGVPLFGYGSLGYTLLTAAAAASPSPSDGVAPSDGAGGSAAPSPAPSGDGSGDSASSNMTPLLIGAIVVVALVAGGLVLMRRRSAAAEDE